MRFLPPTLSLLSLLPFTLSLQTLYLGYDDVSGVTGFYFAWFSDSDPCYDGLPFGFLRDGFAYCDLDLTILGHTNITFTGCPSAAAPFTTPDWNFLSNLPTGVSDGGVPALTCVPASIPPDAPDYANGAFANCIGKPAQLLIGVILYCS